MKNSNVLFFTLMFFLSLFQLNAQNIQNGNLNHTGTCSGTNWNYTAFNNGCVNNWAASHGTPSLGAPNTNPYAWLWARTSNSNAIGEGIFGSYNFTQGQTYQISYRVRTHNGGNAILTGSMVNVRTSNNLTNNSQISVPSSAGSQDINSQPFSSYLNGWTDVTTTFTPNANYSQIWFYPTHGNATQVNLDLDAVVISPISSICNLSASPTFINATHSSSIRTFNVQSDGAWTASSNSSWLTLNTTSGSGNAFGSFSLAANTSLLSRTAVITLNCCAETVDIYVTQAGVPLISCGTSISSYPHIESFENGLGDWTQTTTDDINWTRKSGGTPSYNTGPTSASDGSFYLYTEASGQYSKKAELVSPCYDTRLVNYMNLAFQYHMYGSNMESLEVQITTNRGLSWTTVWSRNGDQGNAWQYAYINLSSYIGHKYVNIRFVGTTGNSFRSDIAIDRISVGEIPWRLGENQGTKVSDTEKNEKATSRSKLSASTNVAPKAFTLTAFPNPFSESTNIAFELTETASVHLDIMDLTGKKVQTILTNENLDVGKHKYVFRPNNLNPGIYFYRLNVNGVVKSGKLILH